MCCSFEANMDPMPVSLLLLSYCGILSYDQPSKKIVVWAFLSKIISITGLVAILILHISHLFTEDPVYTILFALIMFQSINIVTYVRIIVKSDMIVSLNRMFQQLSNSSVRKVRRYERRQVLLSVLGVSIMIGSEVYYLVRNGIKSEAVALILGYRLKDEMLDDRSYFVFWFTLSSFLGSVFVFSMLYMFYRTVIFAATQLAHQIQKQFMKPTKDIDYNLMRQLLQTSNILMETVNESIGILPFNLLAFVFIGIANGISFLVLNSKEFHISPVFAATTIGALDGMNILILFQIVESSRNWNDAITDTRRMAQRFVTDPLLDDRRSANARRSLRSFLILEPAVNAKACDVIDLDRSLILSFFAQLIPFTVMMFTAVKEIESREKK